MKQSKPTRNGYFSGRKARRERIINGERPLHYNKAYNKLIEIENKKQEELGTGITFWYLHPTKGFRKHNTFN